MELTSEEVIEKMNRTTDAYAQHIKDEIETVKVDKIRYYTIFLDAYRERIKEYYNKEYESNPDNFPLMGHVKLNITVVYTTMYEFLCTGECDILACQCFVTDIDRLGWYDFKDMPSQLKTRKALEYVCKSTPLDSVLFETSNDYISFGYKPLYDSINNPHNHAHYLAKKAGRDCADLDVANLEMITALKEIGLPKNNFKLYCLDDIFQKVNNQQFKYEFTECISCYESALFFACTMTGIVCIETLLVLLQKNKLESVIKKTYILEQIKHLESKEIIDGRFYKRLEAINHIRHGSAHSASGEIKQWDAENVLCAIKLLVETYF